VQFRLVGRVHLDERGYQGALALFVSSQVYWWVETAWRDIPIAVLARRQEYRSAVVAFLWVVVVPRSLHQGAVQE
jgi:hypothetical protein